MPAQYAPVGPLDLLWQLYEECNLGGYHLWLAHDVMSEPSEWAHLASWIRKRHEDAFIIMDNSLIELGEPINIDRLIDATKAVEADCVVLPDVLSDTEVTVRMSRETIGGIRFLLPDTPIMAVVQGKTALEAYSCINQHMAYLNPDYLALPRVLTDTGIRRSGLAYDLTSMGIPTHLLGFSNDLVDDFLAAKQNLVKGIDSAAPIWLGQKGISYPIRVPEHIPAYWGRRPEYYFQEKILNPLASTNVIRVRRWLED